ncbi:hypothetical protein DJ500_11265 [Klebsiella pneumoniae]|nr:hypothetical protein DJ500_11265 [Klebsiella pneumoniae]TYE19328.1 hypothetical protein DJ510_12935 [Klebsiella pneumoniae]
MHAFACTEVARSHFAPPELVRIQSGHAAALKPTHKAGRRGGESTARQATFAHLFSQPERVAAPRLFAGCQWVMRGRLGLSGLLRRSGVGVRKSRPEAAEISHCRCRGCNF